MSGLHGHCQSTEGSTTVTVIIDQPAQGQSRSSTVSDRSTRYARRLILERFPSPATYEERLSFLADQFVGLSQQDVSAMIEDLLSRPVIAAQPWMLAEADQLVAELAEFGIEVQVDPAADARTAINDLNALRRALRGAQQAPVRNAAKARLDALAAKTSDSPGF